MEDELKSLKDTRELRHFTCSGFWKNLCLMGKFKGLAQPPDSSGKQLIFVYIGIFGEVSLQT